MIPIIFLDDGGVINDNARRAPQWQRLVGDFFSPRLGGTVGQWARANASVFERQFPEFLAAIREDPFLDPTALRAAMNDRWLVEMASEVGVPPPPDAAERQILSEQASAYIVRRTHSDYPGAVEAIKTLHAAGHTLHTASGEHSTDLDGYLTALGIRDRFGTLYGVDLVGMQKSGPHFYERVFAHAEVAPEIALVVDDSESVLDSAAAVGARTVLCRIEPPVSSRHGHIGSLAELPNLIR